MGARCSLVVVLLFASGCSFPPVDLSERRCPCAAGWSCDVSRNICVPGTADGGPGFDGGPEAGYGRTLTIDGADVSGAHASFPLLVVIASDASLAEHARDDGSDIRFHGSDGAVLAHELESWDGTTGALVAWVRVPELGGARDTVLSLRYGQPSPPAALSPSMVWSDGFVAVWHLNDAPAGSAGEVYDSAGRGHTGVSAPASEQPALVTGRIGSGFAFDASARQYVEVADSPDWNLTARSATISLWFRASTSQPGGSHPRLIERFEGGAPGDGWTLMLDTSSSLTFDFRGSDHARFDDPTNVEDDSWHFVAITLEGSTARFYVDGEPRGSDPYAGLIDRADLLRIGAADAAGDHAFAGHMDEVRIVHAARSADWVLTEFRNQSDPAGFVTVGPVGSL